MTADPFENMTELSKEDFELLDKALKYLAAYGPAHNGGIGKANRLRERFREAHTGWLERAES